MISSYTEFEPFGSPGKSQSKGCNSIAFDNDNGGGVSAIVNNAWIVPPGRVKAISNTDPRITDTTEYNITFDVNNAFNMNLPVTSPLNGITQMVVVKTFTSCK